MTLSEAVKKAGIGGRIQRSAADVYGAPVHVTSNGVRSTFGDKGWQPDFEALTAEDWRVVERTPREWTLCVGGPIPVVMELCGHGCGFSYRDHVRVREVAE